jgi:hypothetical protein
VKKRAYSRNATPRPPFPCVKFSLVQFELQASPETIPPLIWRGLQARGVGACTKISEMLKVLMTRSLDQPYQLHRGFYQSGSFSLINVGSGFSLPV